MLEIDEIHKTFHRGTPAEVRAVQGVHLRLFPGEFLVVLETGISCYR